MMIVLLVEDDEMSRDVLGRRLAKLGYTVITAVNGRDALTAARAEAPSVILMDVCMPDMDGIQATKQLRADIKTAGIPIIALTALNTAADVRRAIEAGCDSYETKPVNLTRLNLKIRKLIPAEFER
jgi:CheY-like chemotaxis protein